MISHENSRTRISSPTGSTLANSSRFTVEPMMQTAEPARISSGVNSRPVASAQLPVLSHSLVLPITLLDQLRPPATTVAVARPSAATA
ncbi:hypothetical protein D3C87_1905950 [compost metagenome]